MNSSCYYAVEPFFLSLKALWLVFVAVQCDLFLALQTWLQTMEAPLQIQHQIYQVEYDEQPP